MQKWFLLAFSKRDTKHLRYSKKIRSFLQFFPCGDVVDSENAPPLLRQPTSYVHD